MSEKMQLFKKKPNTGMHKTVLSKGSIVNGEELKKTGAVVLRPGNTVKCIAEELGVAGAKQFALLGPSIPAPPEEIQSGVVVRPKEGAAGWFNVINLSNPSKPLNEKALRKDAAEAMIESLCNPGDDKDLGDADYEELDWNGLVGELDVREIELDEAWESEEHIRAALIEDDKKKAEAGKE